MQHFNWGLTWTELSAFFAQHCRMVVNSSLKAYQTLKFLDQSPVEEVWVITLRRNLEVIDSSCLFKGTVDTCLIHPREIFRTLILSNASMFILAHNHPSGDPRPSKADRLLTTRIRKLGDLIEIPMRDHVIIGRDKYFSFSDNILSFK